MRSFVGDLRFAFRTFARQRGATALIVLTLALAVGANTAVFAIVDAVFFRPLPYPNANRLVDLNETAPKWGLEFTGVSFPDFHQWRSSARAFEGMGLWDNSGFNLSTGSSTSRVDGQKVTYELLSVLGLRPALGRAFTPEEDSPSGPNVVMIGYDLWQTSFAGKHDVLGQTIRIRGEPYTIIGVLPAALTLDAPSVLWLPLRGDPKAFGQNYSYEGVARLKPGVTLDQARRDLATAHEPIWRATDSLRVVSPRIMPLRDRFVADYRTIGAALGAAAALVLVIACANVAGAMLARSVFRRREISIRVALGASSGRIARQLMTESLALAALGGLAGTIIGRLAVQSLTALLASPPPWLYLGLDARGVAFSILITLATTLLFGTFPSSRTRGLGVGAALAGHRVTGSMPERRLLNALVVAEVALAVVLLVGGGLLLRAYANLRDVDPGFRPDGVANFRVALPDPKYHRGDVQRRFYEMLVSRIAALPGVASAGAVTCSPFTCHWNAFLRAEGAPPTRPGAQDEAVLTRVATPGYFQTMGIKLVKGRFFAENEGAPDGPRPVVINDLLEKQLWPDGSSAIGKRFNFREPTVDRNLMTVVGVVKDVRHDGLAQPARPGLYMSLTAVDSTNSFQRFSVVARTSGDPMSLFAPMRAVLRDLDPELPMFEAKTMRAAVNESLALRRAMAMWLVSFAAIALALAIGGIYAVLSYVVGRRRQEIGVRMALGARSSQILGLVARHGFALLLVGLVLGIPASLVAGRLLSKLLVGVAPIDPLTYGAVIVVLSGTALIAAAIPARRAARVDPKIVLNEIAT